MINMNGDKSRVNVYMPKKLYEQIKRMAKEGERSVNRQCVFLLVKAVEHEKETINGRK